MSDCVKNIEVVPVLPVLRSNFLMMLENVAQTCVLTSSAFGSFATIHDTNTHIMRMRIWKWMRIKVRLRVRIKMRVMTSIATTTKTKQNKYNNDKDNNNNLFVIIKINCLKN